MRHLSLSPDGTKIAFTGGQVAKGEIWALEHFLPNLRASK
jgi:hypothetical protein